MSSGGIKTKYKCYIFMFNILLNFTLFQITIVAIQEFNSKANCYKFRAKLHLQNNFFFEININCYVC